MDRSDKKDLHLDQIEVRSPLEEFSLFMHERIRNAQRLGQDEQVQLLMEAFELGKSLLDPERGDGSCS